jgi:hypothetical protein
VVEDNRSSLPGSAGNTLFRKRMVEGGLIVETGEMSRGGAHRPAALFRRGQGGTIAPIPALSPRGKKG